MKARAQGAIESSDISLDCRHLAGQGATEYLVLLAVVLIVALVSVALLGFFPGMASDAQETQSKAYWASAQPIAITEWAAKVYSTANSAYSLPYLRLRNNGAYPIRITKILGTGGKNISIFYCGSCTGTNLNISDYYYMAPGEEKYIASKQLDDAAQQHYNVPTERYIALTLSNSGIKNSYVMDAAASICSPPSSAAKGTLVANDFGFEYIEYIEGQQITKRQIGKPLIIKCSG